MSYDLKSLVVGDENYFLGYSADDDDDDDFYIDDVDDDDDDYVISDSDNISSSTSDGANDNVVVSDSSTDSESSSVDDFRKYKGQIYDVDTDRNRGFLAGETLVLEKGTTGEVWLDDIKDRFNAKNIIGEYNSEEIFIAGDGTENVIQGSRGSTTMWGGAGDVSDLIFGNSSDDVFVYGKAEGNDTIHGANDDELIHLYNVNFDDIVATNLYGDGINILFNTGNVLTVNDTGISSFTPEFEFADGSRRYMAKRSNQWITTREATSSEA